MNKILYRNIGFLGLIGFLGFLGLSNPAFYLFFIFFIFFFAPFRVFRKPNKVMDFLFEAHIIEKQENKKKILEMFSSMDKINNNDVEDKLKVSNSTATKYLDELQKSGEINEVGREGRYIYYQKS
jgi:ribosomal protein S25